MENKYKSCSVLHSSAITPGNPNAQTYMFAYLKSMLHKVYKMN